MVILPKGYTRGTHRLVPPEDTLARIEPYLASFQITRCANVTGLDRIGIPVYCAIRPRARILQVCNGKGLRHIDARVSACMEAIELFHAENPSADFRRASFKYLLRDGRRVIRPNLLPDYNSKAFFSADFVIDWVKGQDLISSEEVWLPSCAAFVCSPMLYHWSSNGLASGNHAVEATLHALYEIIERDSVSRLCKNGKIRFSPRSSRFIDLETVNDRRVKKLHGRLSSAGIKLVLIWVKSVIPVNTFMAAILDRNAMAFSSTVNVGYGTHLSASVAAIRAITEAAQSRLTFIHGSREDLVTEAYEESHQKLLDFFDRIEPAIDWCSLRECTSRDLLDDYHKVLCLLRDAGYTKVFCVNMTRKPFNIPVVKAWVPGLRLNQSLF